MAMAHGAAEPLLLLLASFFIRQASACSVAPVAVSETCRRVASTPCIEYGQLPAIDRAASLAAARVVMDDDELETCTLSWSPGCQNGGDGGEREVAGNAHDAITDASPSRTVSYPDTKVVAT